MPPKTNSGRGAVSPEVLSRWERDVEVMHRSIRLMLSNRLAEADKVLEDATAEVATRDIDFAGGEHDLRGCFAFVSAIMSLLNGLASLENNQLEIVLRRVWAADELLSMDNDWAGRTVLRGLCLVVAGLVEVMQREFTKGVWHILRSWLYLRSLETEALNFEGHERDCVRSTALIALGVFNLFVSMLPPQAMRTATWITGFKGGREVAMGQLKACWEEGGIQAPLAGLALVGVAVDVSTFLGELSSERQEKHREARRVLDWATEQHPDSFFFDGLEATYLAVEKDLPSAIAKLERVGDVVENLPALKFLVHFRMGVFQMSRFQWAEAAAAFRAAVELHRQVGRRALCPTFLINSHLCYLAAGDTEKAYEVLELCRSYRHEDKKWSPIDKLSLQQAELAYKEAKRNGTSMASADVPDAQGNPEGNDGSGLDDDVCVDNTTWHPMLVLYTKIGIINRAVNFMPHEQALTFLEMVQNATEACKDSDKDNHARGLCIQAEALRQMESWDKALELASQGVDMWPQLSAEGRRNGSVQFCYLVLAYAYHAKGNLTAAKDALSKLEALGADHFFARSVDFKATHIRQLVGAELRDTYTEVIVAGRSKACFIVDVPAEIERIDWDWALDEFTVDFTASFRKIPNGEQTECAAAEIQRVVRHKADAGPVTGSIVAPGRGQLELVFDNSFSMLRGKKMQLRVEPSSLQVRQKA